MHWKMSAPAERASLFATNNIVYYCKEHIYTGRILFAKSVLVFLGGGFFFLVMISPQCSSQNWRIGWGNSYSIGISKYINEVFREITTAEVFGETLVHLPYWSAGLTSREYLYRHHQQGETECKHMYTRYLNFCHLSGLISHNSGILTGLL